ncbi:hypothetical protein BWD42_13015 [Sphingobacterium sp. CZ-UAM]|uniref:S41 family peptidase n=1 Tax=Sphingobacterium sp. CZ-UAM TaxID=1933868 RepID=UPI00098455B7|nr:S41 family peptidase [Sphingobacterium sp. CZ-UAM]OOG18182.1 hypothetical protein BWD42_13015 [Sphingobacterium sp. CZ-UAM]
MLIKQLKSKWIIKSSFIIFPIWCLSACKKSNDESISPNISPTTGTRTEFTLDSIFLYAKEIYLWQDALPDYATFSPRTRYAGIFSDLAAFQKELYDITQYKLNANGIPYEKSLLGEYPRYSSIGLSNTSSAVVASITATKQSQDQLQAASIDLGKVSYLDIDAFVDLDDIKPRLDNMFSGYAVNNIETLIIDLRNNRGGHVETVEYLANLIAPSTINGKIMFSELCNPILRSGNAKILKNQPYLEEGKPVKYKDRFATLADIDFSEEENTTKFKKEGKLETIKKIYFIVNNQTASASELLISCFKPHIPIRLVGQRTYGKPVVFFPINIDKFKVNMISFLLRNADGWSAYFDGMKPDISVSPDSPTDRTETFLTAILNDFTMKLAQKTTKPPLKAIVKAGLDSANDGQNQNGQIIPLIKKHYKLKK